MQRRLETLWARQNPQKGVRFQIRYIKVGNLGVMHKIRPEGMHLHNQKMHVYLIIIKKVN